MFPNSYNGGQFWGPENFALGAAVIDWRTRITDLTEEVQDSLSENENEIRTEADVERLVRTYDMKK